MPVTKRDLVMRISKDTNLTQQDVYRAVQTFLDAVIDCLAKGQTIEFRDFGVFEVRVRKARIGRNPNKPEHVVQIPERKVVKFRPGKKLRAIMQSTAS